MVRPPAVPDDAVDDAGLARARGITIGVLILVAVGSLAVNARTNHAIPSGERWFLLVGSLLFAVVVYVFGVMPSAPAIRPAPWAAITVVTGLAVALFAVDGAGRRADMVSALRRTRADLARAAVAEEWLRKGWL